MSAAISDDPEFDEILKRAGWTPPQQQPAPPRTKGVALSREQCDEVLRDYSPNQLEQFKDQPLSLRLFIDECLPQLQDHIREQIEAATAPLLARIAELEARPMQPGFKYAGIWRAGSIYAANEFVTHQGSLFVAQRKTTEKEMPEDGSGAFVLCAKRGRDAKLPPDILQAVREVQRLVSEEQQQRRGSGTAVEREG